MSDNQDIVLRVAAKAVIVDRKGRILVLREAATDAENTKVGKWELPGGRLNPGEFFAGGLKREAYEETGLEVEVVRPVYVGEWRPVIRGVPHQIIGVFMECRLIAGDVRLSDEHDEYRWIEPRERLSLEMLEPDCFVVDEFAERAALGG